jgi:WD40 repeat protein
MGKAHAGSIGALDRSPDGKTVIALDSCASSGPTPDPLCVFDISGYALVAADGTTTNLGLLGLGTHSPLIAWLDDNRFLALLDVTAHSNGGSAMTSAVMIYDLRTSKLTDALVGETDCFSLSPDRQTFAATRPIQPPIRVSDASGLGGKVDFTTIASGDLQPGQTESLALDSSGSHLVAVEAARDSAGNLVGYRQQVFEKTGTGWDLVMTSPMPFPAEDYVPERVVWLI